MADEAPRIFTVPHGKPFLDALARAVLRGDLPAPGGKPPKPLDLPDFTIILPTRRSAKALIDAFLSASDGAAMLLPQIRPIGQADEDAAIVQTIASGSIGGGDPSVPQAIGTLERRLAIAKLVFAWSRARADASCSPAQAAALAQELASLMDLVETEQCSLDGIAGLVPEGFSEHWAQTLEFLKILTEYWPAHLTECGLISPADRRNRLIGTEVRRLADQPPAGPVIVAGVTGSVPATVELMRVVAGLSNGAVVLPGLDQGLDSEGWEAIAPTDPAAPSHPEHPQFGLKKLLSALNVDRHQVRILAGAESDVSSERRARFVSEALRPAQTTDKWHSYCSASGIRDEVRDGLRGVTFLEAPSAQDEAEAIALILREVLEHPGRTAALVTPDRNLGRRAGAALQSWGLMVDDSAGRPLSKTPPGVLLDHIVEVWHGRFEPRALLALLKHPLTRLGLSARDARRSARLLELMAFRQTYVGAGLEGVRRAVERAERAATEGARRHPALRRIAADSYAAVRDLLDRLEAAMQPLERLGDGDTAALADFAQAHLDVALAFAADENGDHGLLWLGDAGTVASRFLQQLIATGPDGFALGATAYRDFYRSLLASEQVRPTVALHPRLFIWGPMEARLMQPDVVVLGSLNEGIWPEAADAGAWLNRSMLKALGLPAPEERIGFSAHDFSQLFAAPRVVLTRSQKVDGNPTVPSRWLLRIDALLGGLEAADVLHPSPHEPWLQWAAQRHTVSHSTPAPAPEPRPPVEVRPRRMSVTDVETWISNPYAIYAKHVLRLEELRPPEQEPGPDLRGTFIHQALSAFAKDYPDRLPDDPARELMSRLDALLRDHLAHPRIAAFWRPRFERFAEWFADTEAARRKGVSRTCSEVTGERWLEAPAGRFELTARADRIDLRGDGLIITDYKTGTPPRQKQVENNEKPQLPLEAAIALAGGFSGIAETRVAGLNFIRANGGEPPGEAVAIKGDAVVIAEKSISGLEALIARFDKAETAYRPARRAGFDYRYDRYAHLARVAEWSVPGDDDDASEHE